MFTGCAYVCIGVSVFYTVATVNCTITNYASSSFKKEFYQCMCSNTMPSVLWHFVRYQEEHLACKNIEW